MKSVIGLILCVLWRGADDCSHVSTLSSGLWNLDYLSFVLLFLLLFVVCLFLNVCPSRTCL